MRFLTMFPHQSQPWAGVAELQTPRPKPGQWFDLHNQQDPPFGAACCLLPTPQGCDRAEKRTAADQPSPAVPFASLALPGAVLTHHYFYSCFNLLSILIRNIFSLFALAALCVLSVWSQQQPLGGSCPWASPTSCCTAPTPPFSEQSFLVSFLK